MKHNKQRDAKNTTLTEFLLIQLCSIFLSSRQIIGGTPPSLAAKYQIIIIYAASGAATVSTLTSTLLTVMALVDEQYRIRSEKLAPRNSVNRLEAAANAFRYILSCFSWRSRVAQSLTPFLNQHPNSVEADSPRQGQTERTRYGSA